MLWLIKHFQWEGMESINATTRYEKKNGLLCTFGIDTHIEK